MPSHQHNTVYDGAASNYLSGSETIVSNGNLGNDYDLNGISSVTPTLGPTSSTGGGTAHNHGDTDADGSHDHGGTSDGGATANTWRPQGRNFTRQQKL